MSPYPMVEAAYRVLTRNYLKTPIETSVNGFLINTGQKLVLIDTGAGTLFGPTPGRLPASLKAAGYSAKQVDEVYITHMHGDHVGGLMIGEKRTFPNAVVRADQHDVDFLLSEENLKNASAASKGSFQGAMMMIDPYIKAGRFKAFDGPTGLVPGVRAISAYGHTPGHTTYEIESKGEKMVFWGDLMHVATVQFEDPSVTIQFDSDSLKAAAQRKLAYTDAAKHGYLPGIAHVSFPGIGRIRVDGSGYDWLPVNYSPVK